MKVLVIGSGGREHALTWKLAMSPRIKQLYAAPGNPGIARLGECVPINAADSDRLLAFVIQEGIDWTVVGPEAPLCAGIVDRFAEQGFPIFGPTEAAANEHGIAPVFTGTRHFLHQRAPSTFWVHCPEKLPTDHARPALS